MMKIDSAEWWRNNHDNSRLYILAWCGIAWIFVLAGCASMPAGSDVVAIIEGEPITKGDIEYAIEIAHRRDDLSTTRNIHIAEFVQALIDEKLIVQEGRRMRLQNDPQIKNKVTSYHLRESITRLHTEEIIQKADVTESDINDYYRKNYEMMSLAFIETDNEDRAIQAMELLRNGSDFRDVAREFSVHASREKGGQVMLQRRALIPDIDAVVAGMNAGEISPVIQAGSKYYIIQCIGRSEADSGGLAQIRNELAATLKKRKAKQLGDDYIAHLYQKYPPEINQTLLDSINLPMTGEERDRWLEDNSTVARVGDAVLTVDEFVKSLNPRSQNNESRDARIRQWIDTKLVDLEALSRHYESDPAFQIKVDRYTDQLIIKEFVNRFIRPQISATPDELNDYYHEHAADFKRPARHRIQQITARSLDEAEEILNSLDQGADFSWLAKTRSIDRFGPSGGDLGWHTTAQLAAPINNIIDAMKPGDTSPVLEDGAHYKVIKLQDRMPESVEGFSNVERLVAQKVFKEKHKELYGSYVDILKKDARIEINEEAMVSLQELFGQK